MLFDYFSSLLRVSLAMAKAPVSFVVFILIIMVCSYLIFLPLFTIFHNRAFFVEAELFFTCHGVILSFSFFFYSSIKKIVVRIFIYFITISFPTSLAWFLLDGIRSCCFEGINGMGICMG